MGTLEIFPDTLIAETAAGTFQLTGGASTTAVLSDLSDATYVRGNGAGIGLGTYSGTWLMGPLTGMPAGAVVTGVQLRMRYSNMSPEIWEPTNVRVVRPTSGAYSTLGFTRDESIVFAPGTGSTVREWTGPSKDKTAGGTKYVNELLLEPGTRLAASIDLNRFVASNTARLLSFSLVVTYNEAATVTINAPTGTEVVSRPTWTWSVSDPDGDAQRSFDLRVFTAAQVAAANFSPEGATPVYSAYQVTSAKLHKATRGFGQSGNYVAYLRVGGPVRANNNMVSAWASQAFTLSLTTPTAPTPDATYDSSTNTIDVTAQGTDNQLSYNQSTMERSTDLGWFSGSGGIGSYSTTVAAQGAYSMRMTRGSGTGDSTILTASGGSFWVPCAPGEGASAVAEFRAGTTGRTVKVGIDFADANYSLVGSTVYGSTVSDNSAGWTQATVSTTCPAGAAYKRVVIHVAALPAGEFHYIDRAGLYPATGITAWTVGGYAMTTRTVDLERSTDSGATWQDVPSTLVVHDPQRQTIRYSDVEAPSGVTMQYRLKVTAPNDLGEPMTSPYSAVATEPMPVFTSWWLNDIVNGTAIAIDVSDFQQTMTVPATVAVPLDGSAAVVSHDGLKDGELTLSCWLLNADDNAAFRTAVESGNSLLLRSVLAETWWVAFVGDVAKELLRALPVPGEDTPIRHAYKGKVTLAVVERPSV